MPKKPTKTITNFAHDALFRKALENPMVAKQFFDTNLPANIKALVDTNNLRLEKESFIETTLSNSISDVLFSAKFNNTDGYLYLLLEHQSKPDHLMAFRLFKYMINIYDRHLTLNPEAKNLPLVYPTVFYNGKQKYNVSKNLWELFGNSELAKEIWANNYQLINVREIPDDELKKQAWSGTLSFFMKHIFERDLLKRWEEIGDVIPVLARVEIGYGFIQILLEYTLTKMKEGDKIGIEKLLSAKLGEKQGGRLMASIAKKWYHEGELKGKTESKIEIAINMLKKKLDVKLISQVTGLSIEEITKLKNRSHIVN